MDYQTRQEFTDRATARDLGLTPLAPAYTAPDWFLADAPDVATEPRYLCCEHAYEWHLAAGPSEAALLEQARELATQQVLRAEIENREITTRAVARMASAYSELEARNEAQAAELARLRELRAEAADRLVDQVNAAQKDADHWTEKYYDLDKHHKRALADITMKDELITDLRDGIEIVRKTLRDYGYSQGTLLERLEAMHADLARLRQQASAQSGAMTHRSQPPKPAA